MLEDLLELVPFSRSLRHKTGKLICILALAAIVSISQKQSSPGITTRVLNAHNGWTVEKSMDHHSLAQDGNIWDTKYLGHPEVIIPVEDRKPADEIRYAAFGSSCTWGASLANREEDAYIWQLSGRDQERGKNHAIRGSGPAYPASCVSSMIGDDEYDVIILEFWMRSRDGLSILAQRLRQRFPKAIIVMTQLWSPSNILTKKHGISIAQWAEQNGYQKDFIHNETFHKEVLDDLAEKGFWATPKKEWHQTAKDIGAYVYKMPGNVDDLSGELGMLKMGDRLLASDSYHLNEIGHNYIRAFVQNIVDRVGVPKDRTVEDFSFKDHCFDWFESGKIGEGVSYAPNVKLDKMPNTEKYVLEFASEVTGDDENWIEVENKSNKTMELSITYMTLSPPSKYPEVEAVRSDGDSYILSTDVPSQFDGRTVHISKLIRLGEVKPKTKAHVQFKPKEKTEWNFRIIQVLVVPPKILSFFSVA